jgi:antitoxin HicB
MRHSRGSAKKKGRIGSSFDGYLKEEGIYEVVTARAIKRVIVRQLDALMEDQGLTKSELAKRMKTSRAQLDRLLDPENESVTLGTLTRAARPSAGICGWNWCDKTNSQKPATNPVGAGFKPAPTNPPLNAEKSRRGWPGQPSPPLRLARPRWRISETPQMTPNGLARN